jgi:pilus assembly protein CpaE
MNAPWKGGMPGNRDPFAAYVCDEASLDILRPVVIELGWMPEKCNKGGLRNAIQSLSVSASPNILMVDLSESGDPLNDINALAEVCEPGTVVIAIGQVNDVRLYRDLVASGINDYLLKPLAASALRDSLNAWQFATKKAKPTALLDLDIHFGTGALALDLEPGRGLADAIDNPSRIDGLFIERAMIRAHENLAILSAEAPINSPLLTDGAAFLQLQEEFRQAFEMTVVDLPRNMLINFPHLLNDVNVVVVATELTLASARDTIRLLSWLKTNAAHATPVVVANKVQANALEISKADFEASIERKIDYLIPFEQAAAAKAAKLGQAFVEANAQGKATAQIKALAERILGAAAEDESGDDGARPSAAGRRCWRRRTERQSSRSKAAAVTAEPTQRRCAADEGRMRKGART